MSKSDTVKGALDAFSNASKELLPPPHVTLRESDKPFWESIVRARAYNSWTDSDLEVAANLARCKSDIERIHLEITEEGDIVINARGTQIINPKHTLMETLSRRAVALSRMIHVHAEANMQAKDRAKQTGAEQQARAGVEVVQSDDLLAKPTAH